jgi:hypothetical protein
LRTGWYELFENWHFETWLKFLFVNFLKPSPGLLNNFKKEKKRGNWVRYLKKLLKPGPAGS